MTMDELRANLSLVRDGNSLMKKYLGQIEMRIRINELCPCKSVEKEIATTIAIMQGVVERLAKTETLITKYISMLPYEEQKMMEHRYDEGMSIKKIAQYLNYDETTIKRRLRSAKWEIIKMSEEDKDDQSRMV